MKLGLLGYPITHSLSPVLYQKFLGSSLESYKLFSFERKEEVPSLQYFADDLDGLNITSPYKTHFIDQITIYSDLVKKLGAVNTLAFTPDKVIGTNTDVLAVVEILKNYIKLFGSIHITLLGDGVMARVTKIVADDLQISLRQFSRKTHPDIATLDLSLVRVEKHIIINSCSRDFVFEGRVSGDEVFWDYNYSFIPHQKTLSSRVMAYHDGQEMLELQAQAAIKFWKEVIPKLK
jgi:shikimate dehydrogenase